MIFLAGLTPPEFDIEIVDENVDTLNMNDNPDLVGISCMTVTAKRGYEISEQYRAKGIPVILGGIHPTVVSEEAAQHADAIVVGEAENVWNELLDDFDAGKLRPVYKSDSYHNLSRIPTPRWDLVEKYRKKYTSFTTIQSTRGCPYDCEFCSTTVVCGKKIRTRPVKDVLNEIKKMKFDRLKPLIFYDDTINCIPSYAEELFKGLIPLNIKWAGYATVNMTENEKLLNLAHKSGCVGLFVGFETIKKENQRNMRKSSRLKFDYNEAINIFHKYKIGLLGAFLFGLDYDDSSVFEDTYEFIKESKLDSMTLNIVQPYPGTRFYNRLKEENRITVHDWNNYILDSLCYQPKNMTQDELINGFRWIYHKVSRLWPTTTRIVRNFLQRKNSGIIILAQNMGCRRTNKMIKKR
ncbi:MAG: hypothetical protein A2W19_13315 [Spirochaetes bacterium RBG_16_49_21]|nr:MAG: hypothetical protein A2W19_13315 [Spirochaetes bacterium RBG_16_49_21]